MNAAMKTFVLPTALGIALVLALGAGAYVGITQHNALTAEQQHSADLSKQLKAQKVKTAAAEAEAAAAQADATSCGKRADAWGQAIIDEADAWQSALNHIFETGYNPDTDPAFTKVFDGEKAGVNAKCSTSHISVPTSATD